MTDMMYHGTVGKILTADVLVVGGGPAGFAAAIAAAETGSKTILVEHTGMLGGMATAGLVGPFMTSYDGKGEKQLIKGVFDRLVTRIDEMGGGLHPSKVEQSTSYCGFHAYGHAHCGPFNSEALKLAMDDMVAEAGIKLLLHTSYVDSILEDGKIKYAIVFNKEGLTAIEAKEYVDCTGDADVAARSGVETVLGNANLNNALNPASLFFEVCNVDGDKVNAYMTENRDRIGLPMHGPLSWLCTEGRETGEWKIPRTEICIFETPNHAIWKVNVTRVMVDATKVEELTRGEMEGRKQVIYAHNFIRRHVPGFEDSIITVSAPTLGIRETRHILGEYVLTVQDLYDRRIFDDRIAVCANSIDIHEPNGIGGEYILVDTHYSIPYRSLIPLHCANLLVGGRCISATSDAAAAFRVMPPCFAIGEAAGTAAGMCALNGIRPSQLDHKLLQEKLIENGAAL